jgi:Tfp pilus assembly protein PilF
MCANRPDDALDKLREAEKLAATADVSGLMGNILMEEGRTAEARQAFTTASARQPTATDLAHVYRGNLALLANDPVRAEQEFEKALVLNPYCPEAIAQLRRMHGAPGHGERSRSAAPR